MGRRVGRAGNEKYVVTARRDLLEWLAKEGRSFTSPHEAVRAGAIRLTDWTELLELYRSLSLGARGETEEQEKAMLSVAEWIALKSGRSFRKVARTNAGWFDSQRGLAYQQKRAKKRATLLEAA